MSEWKEHDGKGQPEETRGQQVQIEYRTGAVLIDNADYIDWHERGDATIARYRVLDTPSSEEDEPVKTLRDEFAMAALVGIGTWMPVDSEGVVHSNLNHGRAQMDRAKWAYAQADAMLAARKEK